MKTFGSFFSGGGLADVGYKAAGLTPVCAVEYKPELAAVYQTNHGDHIAVADVREVDPMKMERPDLFHASPVCTRFSTANTKGEESPLDIACAEATANAVKIWMPEVVVIENVWGYRNSISFALIRDTLDRLGYWTQVDHLCAADFGTPQTRWRLILRASRDGWLPPLPQKTRWMGWYEAIADFVDDLPESEFAPWQLERLPDLFKTAMVTNQNEKENGAGGPKTFAADEPSGTLLASSGSRTRAFLVDANNTCRDATVRSAHEPALTIRAGHGDRPSHVPAAFLIDDAYGAGGGPTTREDADPAFTLTARNGGLVKGFLMNGQNASSAEGRGEEVPCYTLTATAGKAPLRAFIVDGQQTNPGKTPGDRASRTLITRDQEEPLWTIPATTYKGEPRPWLSLGRVVKMTPRAGARFMGLTDAYLLPDHNATAWTVLGNGVCPQITEAIARSFQ